MILGIEGTGSQDWQPIDMRRSFVRKVLAQSQQSEKYYFIGPSNSGSDGPTIVGGAWSVINSRIHADSASIQLVGYSRGAAYCMYLAKLIGDAVGGQRVSHLILFDAVGRQAEFAIPDQIPTNVKACFHAYRNPAGGSRAGFENVGLHVADPNVTKMKINKFMASHGGMGGTWYDARDEEDKGGDIGVWKFKVKNAVSSNNLVTTAFVNVGSSQAMNTVRAMSPSGVGTAVGMVNIPVGVAVGGGLSWAHRNEPGMMAQETSDRNQVIPTKAPLHPVMDAAMDHDASDRAGKWMWDQLVEAGVLPGGASPSTDASPANGKNYFVGSACRVS